MRIHTNIRLHLVKQNEQNDHTLLRMNRVTKTRGMECMEVNVDIVVEIVVNFLDII